MGPSSTIPLRPITIVVLFSAALSAAALYGLWLERHPFGDEGSVCHLALELVAGKRLYLETWNEKTPLHFLLVAGWFQVFGVSLENLRALAATEFFLVVLLVYRLSGNLAPWALAVTALLAPWYQAHHGVQEATLAVLALAMLNALALQGRLASAVIGALGATGVWTKQSFMLVFVALAGERPDRRFDIAAAAWVAALLWMACVWALAQDGLWLMPPFGNVEAAAGAVSWRWGEDNILCLLHLAVVIAVVLAARAKREDPIARHAAWFALWLALPGLARFGFFRMWPSFVVLIVAVARLLPTTPSTGQTRWPLSATTALLAIALVAGIARWNVDDGNHDNLRALAARVVELTPNHEPIWVGPHEPLVYCLAHRQSPISYSFALPWSPPTAVRETLVAQLRASPPAVIIDMGEAYAPWQGSLESLLPDLRALLATHYQRVEPPDGVSASIFSR